MRYGWLATIIVLVALSVLDRSLMCGLADPVQHEFGVAVTGAKILKLELRPPPNFDDHIVP